MLESFKFEVKHIPLQEIPEIQFFKAPVTVITIDVLNKHDIYVKCCEFTISASEIYIIINYDRIKLCGEDRIKLWDSFLQSMYITAADYQRMLQHI